MMTDHGGKEEFKLFDEFTPKEVGIQGESDNENGGRMSSLGSPWLEDNPVTVSSALFVEMYSWSGAK